MKTEGQMVRALRLGDSGWALLGAQVQFVPLPDGTIVFGVVGIGARDNALVNNEPRAVLLIELGRFKQEEVAAVLAQADEAKRPALVG
jgi:hypothetical protein